MGAGGEQVDREHVTGAATLEFVHTSISNAYRNLTNIVLRIAPKAAQDVKGVLLNAHFDTVFGTSGERINPSSLCLRLFSFSFFFLLFPGGRMVLAFHGNATSCPLHFFPTSLFFS